MFGFIFKTTDLINNKIYIGQHICSSEYKDNYYLGSGKELSLAIKEYGRKNFKKEILEECDSISELNERERYWIAYYDARNPEVGYNIQEGGRDSKIPEEMKKDISNTLKKFYKKDPKNHPWTGRHHTEETKKKISHTEKGKIIPLEVRLKMSEANRKRALIYENYGMRGKHHTEEVKRRIGLSLKNKKFITNGLINKYVTVEEAEKYFSLNEGWKYGRISISTKGRIRITNGINNKYVTVEEYNNVYINQGYINGITRKEK